jgi:oligopeptide transport system permease protein
MPDISESPSVALPPVAGGAAGVEPGMRVEAARSLWSDAWHDLRRNPLFLVSGLLILLLAVVAIAPGLFTSVDPSHADLSMSLKGPRSGHVFGFNLQGQDVYSRTIHGARASVEVGVLATLMVVVLGGLVGVCAGYYGGVLDALLSRVSDIFFGLPLLLGALVFLSAFPVRNAITVAIALAVLGWPQVARIMRGSVLATKNVDYVVAARALGAGTRRVIMRHILPNAIAPVIVVATISLGIYITTEATLSFLGIGLPGSIISWGGDIAAAQESISSAPYVLLFPAGALSVTVLSFIMLGDAVRDALDPKLR